MNLTPWMTGLLPALPALLGAFIVGQAGLNRKIAAQWSLPLAALMNSSVLFTLSILLFTLTQLKPQWFSGLFQHRFDAGSFSFWYLIPGALGMSLILGSPWCIARWGATYTFVLLLSAQLATSLFWDHYVEGTPLSKERVFGVILAALGALLACKSPK